MLIELLSDLSGLVKVRDKGADIDSSTFKLHYRITSLILFCFCMLITARALIGVPISCIHSDKLPGEVVNTYCWIHTTFTLPKYYHRGDSQAVYPGVGIPGEDDEKVYHSYYQWVPFVLFLQGIIFYVPHWLWRAWDGGKLRSLVQGLLTPLLTREQRQERIYLVMDYILISLRCHDIYAAQFVFCEFLNFFNAIFNMWFLNAFLGGSFMDFGPEVVRFIQMNQEDRTDPLIMVFPRVTKCTFQKFGSSGTMEKHDVMCVLALNILNEKIFVFLWFWFVLLSLVSALAFVYRIVIFSVPALRVGILQKKFKFKYKNMAPVLSRRLSFGDCFLLYLLSKNVEIISFSNLLEKLSSHFENADRSNQPDIELSLPNDPMEHFRLVGESTA